jgi:16S rRNA (cytosine967-C5)-methyltransferase
MFIAAADTLDARARRELGPALSSNESLWLAQMRQRVNEPLPLGVAADLPDWLIERMLAAMTQEQVLAIGQAMQQPAPLDLRVNTLLATRAEVLAALRGSGYVVDSTPYSPLCLRVQGKPTLEQHPLYLSGKVEVQDEGSQLLGLLLAPRRREMVVDFCAGAGGKTLLLGQLMRSEGALYAFDVSASRMMRLRKRLARSGLNNVHPEVIAHENDVGLKRLAGKIDRVLVDAPCTGTGTLRRNPDLKWRQTDAAVDLLRVKQAAILDAAARLVKFGGRLVYATCSLLPQENDEIVDDFLRTHPEFSERRCQSVLDEAGVEIDCGDRLRLLPQVHGTDGFFAAVLQRGRATD